MAAESYLWAHLLRAPVANNGTVVVPTPGFENPANYNTGATGVVHEGKVLNPPQFLAAWNGPFTQVTVTNRTGAAWRDRDMVYVAVPGVPADIDALASRVTANEASIAQHNTRITTNTGNITVNTGAIAGHETRIAALEAAAP